MKSSSLILSIISLCFSVGIMLVWIFSNFKLEIIDLSTFIGASVGLIAIMVTFSIGYQIYNNLDSERKINDSIKEFKELLFKKDHLINDLKIELKIFKYNTQLEAYAEKYELTESRLKEFKTGENNQTLQQIEFLTMLDYFYLALEAENYYKKEVESNDHLEIPFDCAIIYRYYSNEICMKALYINLLRFLPDLLKSTEEIKKIIAQSINSKLDFTNPSMFDLNIIKFNKQLSFISSLLSQNNTNLSDYKKSLHLMDEWIKCYVKEKEEAFNE